MRFVTAMRILASLAAGAVLGGTALAQDAVSQGFDAHGFAEAPSDGDLGDLLFTWRPEVQQRGAFGFGGLFEFANEPLVLDQQDANGVRETDLLDDVFGLNLSGHYAFHERVAVALAAPVYFHSQGIDGSQAVAMGDIRLAVPVGLVMRKGELDDGFGLSIVPFVVLPTGAAGRFLGSPVPSAGGVLSAGYLADPIEIDANVGFDSNHPVSLENINGAPALLASLGFGLRATDWMAVHVEARFDPALKSNDRPLAESPGEALLSLRGRYDNGLYWTLGGGGAYTRGISAAQYRIFAGVGYAHKSIDRDKDFDLIPDSRDACPLEPETVNGWKDDDGCPDELATVHLVVFNPEGKRQAGVQVVVDGQDLGRTDANGVLVMNDVMPEKELAVNAKANEKFGLEPFMGSYTTREGVQEYEMHLGYLPGSVKVVTRSDEGAIVDSTVDFIGPTEKRGLKVGSDGERIFVLEPGDWKVVVSADSFGTEDRDLHIDPDQRSLVVIEVVLKPAKVEVVEEEVITMEQVQFDFDKDTIRAESLPTLAQVAATLLAHPEIKRVEVQGHTDDVGSNKYNKDLSQRRMDSVVKYLTSRGVSADRLVAAGFGEECPIETNGTDEGRAMNRRVQFIIIDPPPSDGIPCHDGKPGRRTDVTKRKVVPGK